MQWLMRWLHKLWQHPLIALVIGTMLVWGLENYYADLLKTYGTRSLITLALAVISVVVISWVARRLWQRFGPQRRILVGFPPAAQRGLIALYGRPETLTKAIMQHQHRLEYLCLIVTDESVQKARDTIKTLESEGWLISLQVREERVRSAWDPDETALAVERAIRQGSDLRLDKSDLICDVTGGTKAMTVGAMLACLAENLRVQMVPAEYDEALKVLRPIDVIQLRLD